MKDDHSNIPRTVPIQSATFSNPTNAEIRRAAATGIYDIRGGGSKRSLPHFNDLLFLGASISRYPLEGYREKCDTKVVLGTRFAKKPIELDIPVTIAGMSFGALSGPAKEALGRGATMAGTSTTTGDGGMTEEERGHSSKLVYQYLPSRYGMNPDDLRRCDAIEIVGLADTKTTTVTGVEMFTKILAQGIAGYNVGCLLRGIEKTAIKRGMVICKPGSVKPHTKFKCEVYVLSKDEGGRHTPFFNGYRPQFYFRTTDVTGDVHLPENVEMVMPGDNVTLTVTLLAEIAMEKGLRFAIREGGRTVGAGQVTEILD
jgi:hypothetical protein